MESRARQEVAKQRLEEAGKAGEEEEVEATEELAESTESAAGEASDPATAGPADERSAASGVELPESDGEGGDDIQLDTGPSAVGTFDGAGEGAGQILDLIA